MPPPAAAETSSSGSSSDSEEETTAPATGTLLRYSCASADLALGPWKFEGEVVKGEPGRCVEGGECEEGEEEGETPTLAKTKTKTKAEEEKGKVGEFDIGRMWECPFLVEVPVVAVNSDDDEDSDRGGGGAAASGGGEPAAGGQHRGVGSASAAAAAVAAAGNSTKTTTAASSPLPASLHLLCVSPYPRGPAITASRPSNPPLYWLGDLDEEEGTFGFSKAVAGPSRLDLGDVLYAPTAAAAWNPGDDDDSDSSSSSAAAAAATGLASSVSPAAAAAAASALPPVSPLSLSLPCPPLNPPIMMAWAQELRGSSRKLGFGYSGALTLPRELSVVAVAVRGAEKKKNKKTKSDGDGDGGGKVEFRLRQRLPASVSKLRKGEDGGRVPSSSAADTITAVVGGPAVEIPGAKGHFVDLELVLLRPSSTWCSSSSTSSSPPAPAAAVVLLRPWLHAGTETDLEPCAAAVVADWATGELSVVWPRRLLAAATAGRDQKKNSFPPLLEKDQGKEKRNSPAPPPPSLQIDWEAGVARRTGGPCAGLRRGGRNRSLSLRVVSFLLKVFWISPPP